MSVEPSRSVLAPVQRGPVLLAGAGLSWALLCLWLAHDGHGPSHTLIPIPRDRYYLMQAALLVPVLFGQWRLCTAVCTGVARRLGAQADAPSHALAQALALPILFFLVVPDAVVYATWGFHALGKLVRISAPLSFAFSLALTTRALRTTCGLSLGRAFLSALAGILSQAFVGGLILR